MIPLNVVFSIEEVHCAKEVHVCAQRALSTGSPVLMLHDNRGLIANGPTRLPRAQAPVEVLTIHKETLVEQSDLLDHLAAYQQARTAHRVDFDRHLGIDERQVVASEARAGGQHSTEA